MEVQKVKSFAFVVLFGIAAIGLIPSPAPAAVLLVNIDGQLTGATGVIVDGSLYDVTFMDGTCVALFSGCDELSDFTFPGFSFNDPVNALLAAAALLDQVFIDDILGLFDTDPELTLGCESDTECLIYIPYGFSIFGNEYLAGFSANANTLIDSTFNGPIEFGTDTGLLDNSVFAVFAPAVVPLPPAVLLFGSGLVALFGYARIGRRRRRQT